jgi:hypothetical protein
MKQSYFHYFSVHLRELIQLILLWLWSHPTASEDASGEEGSSPALHPSREGCAGTDIPVETSRVNVPSPNIKCL